MRSSSRRTAGGASPTAAVKAASETNPRQVTPRSMLTMSPSRSGSSQGMPCTSRSLTDQQIAPGYGGRPPGA